MYLIFCLLPQVADDGYGVSYIIAGEDTIFYHITSKVSSQLTVSSSSLDGVGGGLRRSIMPCYSLG